MILLFSVLFINGFEAAGYQTSLSKIGEMFSLNSTNQGLIVFLQLAASFLSPLILAPFADRRSKKGFLLVFFVLEIASSVMLSLATSFALFAVGISLLGFASGTAQYLAFAALAEIFPATGAKKVALATTFYSIGAVIAPVLMGLLLKQNVSWNYLFVMV